MIISHKYKYVFIQLGKTASSAMARELCEFYDGREILWKHARYEDFLLTATEEEKKYFTFAGIRNPLDFIVSRYHLRLLGRNNDNRNNLKQYLFLGKNNNFDDFFFKFFCRSIYFDWRIKKYSKLDYIYRYENLQADFSLILNKLGIRQIRPLPLFNQTPNKKNFLDYYNNKKIQQVAIIIFGPFFKKWNYQFPQDWSRPGLLLRLIFGTKVYLRYFLNKLYHLLVDPLIVYRRFIARSK